jgi:hypothetical protein
VRRTFFNAPTMHARVHAAGLLSSKSFVARHYAQREGSNRKRILLVAHSSRMEEQRGGAGSKAARFVKSVFALIIKIVLVIYLNSQHTHTHTYTRKLFRVASANTDFDLSRIVKALAYGFTLRRSSIFSILE